MAPRKPRPKPKPKPKYDYELSGKYVTCISSTVSKCTLDAKLWHAGASGFHDAALQDATRQINEVLDRVERGNGDRERHLCFIDVEGRRMLVWSHHGERIASNDERIVEALKITDAANAGGDHHG